MITGLGPHLASMCRRRSCAAPCGQRSNRSQSTKLPGCLGKQRVGEKSAKRTAQQTQTARFWLVSGPIAYHPFVRELARAKGMDVVDSARFMALASLATNDALVAVLDAKYHYNFWRPVTAIRNADIDNNAATDREAAWQPIADTPMHPEYPCAHC